MPHRKTIIGRKSDKTVTSGKGFEKIPEIAFSV